MPPLALVLQLLALGGAVAFLYGHVFADLATQWWTDENYSHGFLVPLISGYLLWERRRQLMRCRIETSAWGYPVLLLGLALLIVGQASAFGYPVRLSFLVTVAGLTMLLAGRDALRIAAFPLIFLLFMIPLPAPVLNKVAFPLQLLAARVAGTTLDLANIPVLREGNIIDLANSRLEVTEACSGIRSLVALLALAVVFAYFSQKTWRSQAALVASAIPIAVVANAARVTLTGVLAQIFGSEAAMGFYHLFSGWLIFVVAFGLMVMVGGALGSRRPGTTGT
ncbi:MAG TPA: exosortase A [bacterium]|nr:exosortase A [bacterium]